MQKLPPSHMSSGCPCSVLALYLRGSQAPCLILGPTTSAKREQHRCLAPSSLPHCNSHQEAAWARPSKSGSDCVELASFLTVSTRVSICMGYGLS